MSTAQTMKIYSIIASIEQELEESPRTKFSGQNRRVVEIERLYDLLGDLKVTIPEDIRRATGVLAEAENRINDAKEQAEEILAQAHEEADGVLSQAQSSAENLYHQAQVEYETRVSDAEVYKEACARAAQISAEAEANANAIYNGARKYADDILSDVQRYLTEYHSMIAQNRNELGVSAAQQPQERQLRPAWLPAVSGKKSQVPVRCAGRCRAPFFPELLRTLQYRARPLPGAWRSWPHKRLPPREICR